MERFFSHSVLSFLQQQWQLESAILRAIREDPWKGKSHGEERNPQEGAREDSAIQQFSSEEVKK